MFKKMNFPSKTEIEILSFLIDRPGSKFYEKEISGKTGVSAGAANQALRLFTGEMLLKKEKKGRLNFYEANMRNPMVRQMKVLLNIMKIYGLVKQIRRKTEKIVLFGSCSTGLNTEGSDIDLFIVARDRGAVARALGRFQPNLPAKMNATVVEPDKLGEFKAGNRLLYSQINNGIKLWDANELRV